jgi:tetratricopeptide (TPR) repeat protein
MIRFIFVILAFYMVCLGYTQSIRHYPIVDSLVQRAEMDDSLTAYGKMEILEHALSLSKEVDYKKGIYLSHLNLGIVELNLNEYSEALHHFQESLSLAAELDNKRYLAETNYYLANLHIYLEQYKKALFLSQNALRLYGELNDSIWVAFSYNSLGIAYGKLGQPEKSLASFQKSFQIFTDKKNEFGKSFSLNNIGEYYLTNGQPKMALGYYSRSLGLSIQNDDERNEAISSGNMGLAYRALKQHRLALTYFEKSLALSQRNGYKKAIYDNYKDISDTYWEMGDYKKALVSYRQYDSLRSSIFSHEMNEQLAELRVRHATMKSEKVLNDLKYKQELSRFRNYLVVGGLMGILALAGLLVWRLRNDVKKKKELLQKKEELHKIKEQLAETELRNKQLESEQLQRELGHKKQDLTNFAIDITRKNEFSEELLEKLKDLKKGSEEERAAKVSELIVSATLHLQVNEELSDFQRNVEIVNSDFFNKLNESFPNLTQNDKSLCGLIRLNLSSKEIAALKNISARSVEMGRYRLRKKLGLQPEEAIHYFLDNI